MDALYMSLSLSRRLLRIGCLLLCSLSTFATNNLSFAVEIDFEGQIQPILKKYCAGCHNEGEAESDFRADSFAGLMKGSKKGAVIQVGLSQKSKIIELISGKAEPKMPPDDEPQPTEKDIEMIKQWIDQGAKSASAPVPLRERLKELSLPSTHKGDMPISSMAILPDASLVALGTYGEVRFVDPASQTVKQTVGDIVGKVTSLRPSSDGKLIAIASGVAGIGGQITIVDLSTFKIVKQLEGHRDTLYSAVINPTNTIVASGGYDRRIHLWNLKTGEVIRSLDGHNGAIYDLDFDRDGALLASSSADETVKIWRVDNGTRLDTLGQPEAEQYNVRFSNDGKFIIAAGADRRVRMWRVISKASEAINPLVEARFAHEKSVLVLRYSADGNFVVTVGEDKTVKLWTADRLNPVGEIGNLVDIPSDAAWSQDGKSIYVSSLDGSITTLSTTAVLNTYQQIKKTVEMNLADQKNGSATGSSASMSKTTEITKASEVEPNNTFATATAITIPAEMSGVISAAKTNEEKADETDEDWFEFQCLKDQQWIVETIAKKEGSPIDSRIEIRDAEGNSILRTRLQATRESYFTFRGKDSNISDDFRLHRWEDMELNEYLYCGGEVVKLWLYPRGPDSGFRVYPGFGSRFTYFDTTATTHALGEPTWIVRELESNQDPLPNGLPVFSIFYDNDDDSTRKTDKDSRVLFTAPKDGKYFVRVRDARGLQGDDYKYRLVIRPVRPDFEISTDAKELKIAPGTGAEIVVTANRKDEFQGEITVTLDGLPPGAMTSQPFTIQKEQLKAITTVFLPKDTADVPAEFKIKIQATALVGGVEQTRAIGNEIVVRTADKPNVQTTFVKGPEPTENEELTEIVIHPGETISTFIAVDRGAFQGEVTFGGDDSGRNLPHGIIVDNIGLSGLLVRVSETRREVFLTAAPWLEPQVRPFHLRSTIPGNPTSKPILLRVIKDN